MNKKILSTILILALACMSLIGCGKSEPITKLSADAEAVTITGDIGDAVDMNVDIITSDTNSIEAAIADATDESVKKVMPYDITILDKKNNPVQPDGTVTVTIDLDKSFNTDNHLAVYYFNDNDNTAELMNSTVKDNKISFTTTHFSTYVVTETVEVTIDTEVSETEVESEASVKDAIEAATPASDITNQGKQNVNAPEPKANAKNAIEAAAPASDITNHGEQKVNAPEPKATTSNDGNYEWYNEDNKYCMLWSDCEADYYADADFTQRLGSLSHDTAYVTTGLTLDGGSVFRLIVDGQTVYANGYSFDIWYGER